MVTRDDETDPARVGGPAQITPDVLQRRICDFDLRIEGGPLETVVARFRGEVARLGLVKLEPAFYLADEWGVPDGTVAIGIPFYLADERLKEVQRARQGIVEGTDDEDILRYLRHELGHVVNYAYRLYEREDWTLRFGPMSRPYLDDFRSVPFDPGFVRHLPGHYAQKHPDDDWAETFAVWMTPSLDWRALYGDAPVALAKLVLCDRVMLELKGHEPHVTAIDLDGDVTQIRTTVQTFYDDVQLPGITLPRSLDGDLAALFARDTAGTGDEGRTGSAALLIQRNEDTLASTVYRWTGVDPARTCTILRHLQSRARALGLAYALKARDGVLMELATFLTTLALNEEYGGSPPRDRGTEPGR